MNAHSVRNVTTREFIAALERDGFAWTRGKSSHRIYTHPDGRWLPVTFHGDGETFPDGTLGSMLRSTCWTDADAYRLGLTKRQPKSATRHTGPKRGRSRPSTKPRASTQL
ncbi:MAG: type II toxin-antitoxin system HicA family toxin [Polyangiales bacterium]